MKRNYTLSVISVLVLILFITLALGSGDTTEPERVERETPVEDTTTTPEGEPEVADEIFHVGETVKMGELEFTVNSARWDKGSEFMKPEPGERWLVLDCTIENKGEKSSAISSLLMFSLYDEDHYSRDVEIFADTKGSLDGELGARRTMRGEIAFNVEEGQTKWEFIFQPNVLGFGQAIYIITEADVN
jgi:hypothetical protein